jgi:cyclopropane fatty-acyl-phospholipid synthase-like methyltransferase
MAEHKPELTLVDFDTHNLRLAKKRVVSMGLKGTVNTAWRDLTSEKSFESVPYIKGLFSWFVLRKTPLFLNRRLPLNSYDRVECTGFMEYLPKEKAARFVSNAFELLKSTGTFITSNIRDTHSQRAFTEGVVQWPFIQFRSVDEVVEIIESSKIKVNAIDVYLPDDEVYAVYVMRKRL